MYLSFILFIAAAVVFLLRNCPSAPSSESRVNRILQGRARVCFESSISVQYHLHKRPNLSLLLSALHSKGGRRKALGAVFRAKMRFPPSFEGSSDGSMAGGPDCREWRPRRPRRPKFSPGSHAFSVPACPRRLDSSC